jgi:hypothetical protein
MTSPTPKNWPKLSETLAGPRHPLQCQSCGRTRANAVELTRWREHDEQDKPTGAVVVLCKECSDRTIEPHPRLYSELSANEPHPGTMELCLLCIYRSDVRCLHKDLKANGGLGLAITCPRPTVAMVCGRGKGGCRRHVMYVSPPSKCAGREEAGK